MDNSTSTKIKLEKIKIEKSDTKKNMRKIDREKYEIKIEVLNDLEMKEESDTEYINQLKREIRCLMRANTNAETGTKIWRKLYSDIELESKLKMLREAGNYKKELEAFRLRNGDLLALVEEKTTECVGLEDKFNGLSSAKAVIDNQLKGVQAECSELMKRVAQLEDGHRVMCEREKYQQEQILYLSNVKDKCEQLETMNKELEVEKVRLEEELNKSNRELDEEKRRKFVGLDENLNELSSKKDVAERKNVELEYEKNKLEKELIDSMTMCNDLKDQNAHLQALMCERENVALNKIANLCREIQNLKRENGGLNRTDSEELGLSGEDVSDNDEENNNRNETEDIQTENGNESEETMSQSTSRSEEIMSETRGENEESMSERSSGSEGDQHEASAELDDEALPTAGIMNEPRNRSEGTGSEIRRLSEESLSERSSGNEGIQPQASVGLDDEVLPAVGGDYSIPIDIESDSVIEISEGEDSSGSDDDSPPTYRLERPLSDQKCGGRPISCKKEFPLGSTSKRKWGADAGTSEIKTEDEDKRKKLDAGENILLELFSMKMETPSVSPRSRNTEAKVQARFSGI